MKEHSETVLDDTRINDYLAEIFIRYFRAASPVRSVNPALGGKDKDLLLLYWSLSKRVMSLAEYIVRHHQQLRPSLQMQKVTSNGRIVGRLDAMATEVHRLRTGDVTSFVCSTPNRSFISRENMMLAWTLDRAWRACHDLSDTSPSDSFQAKLVETRLALLHLARRTETVKSIRTLSLGTIKRPTAGDIELGLQSRYHGHRLAAAAALLLFKLEIAEIAALREVARDVLVGPLEVWRRFELAVALSLIKAIAAETGEEVHLGLLLPNRTEALASVGPYKFHWQTKTASYATPIPEPSENIAARILSSYGLSPSGERPDIIVRREDEHAVVAIVEVKWFASEQDIPGVLSEAVRQVVRYARGYEPLESINCLLGSSMIAMSSTRGIRIPELPEPNVPFLLDSDQILGDGAKVWAKTVADLPLRK